MLPSFSSPLRFPRRQLVLFVVAVFLPCTIFVVLALRMLAQERELGEKRVTDERRLLASEVSRQLLDQLELIERAEISHASESARAHPATVVMARIVSGRVVLPWQADPAARAFAALRSSGRFGTSLRLGERAEHRDHAFEEAARLYRVAGTQARDPLRSAYANFLTARAVAAQYPDSADRAFTAIAQLSASVRDENGVPLALYAFHRLSAAIAHTVAMRRAFHALTATMASSRWTSPAACYAALGIDDDTSGLTRQHCGELERAERSAEDGSFASVLRQSAERPNGEATWFPIGSPVWLASVERTDADHPSFVALRLDAVGRGETFPMPPGASIVTSERPGAQSLGGRLPGLWLTAPEIAKSAINDVRAFYLIAIALALSVCLFGAYLLWRDVQREMALAQLRSQFVAGVTHELKTPLTAIRMFAETLREREHASPQLRGEYLDTIVMEAERLSRLLNNVLEFSSVERGQRRYRLEPGDLRDCTRAALRTMTYPLAQQGFLLVVEDDAAPLPVRIDADAVEQAVLNLLTNAMKYSRDHRELVVRLARNEDFALVSVRDRGVGIAPEEHTRIFEKFYRIRGRLNDATSGAGLGLTLIEHIVHAHGGRVTVESVPDEGSTFTLWFPLHRPNDDALDHEDADRSAEVIPS